MAMLVITRWYPAALSTHGFLAPMNHDPSMKSTFFHSQFNGISIKSGGVFIMNHYESLFTMIVYRCIQYTTITVIIINHDSILDFPPWIHYWSIPFAIFVVRRHLGHLGSQAEADKKRRKEEEHRLQLQREVRGLQRATRNAWHATGKGGSKSQRSWNPIGNGWFCCDRYDLMVDVANISQYMYKKILYDHIPSVFATDFMVTPDEDLRHDKLFSWW